jgi:hypothetical protein
LNSLVGRENSLFFAENSLLGLGPQLVRLLLLTQGVASLPVALDPAGGRHEII